MEFRAIDRPLDKAEMEKLRTISSRAEITPTSFTNTYNYGDFHGKPEALVAHTSMRLCTSPTGVRVS